MSCTYCGRIDACSTCGRLRAELEELRASATGTCNGYLKRIEELKAENERLKEAIRNYKNREDLIFSCLWLQRSTLEKMLYDLDPDWDKKSAKGKAVQG